MISKKTEKEWKDISRGAEEIIPEVSLKEKLNSGKKLKVKFGADPTARNLHLGHSVVMEKLRVFQKYGHEIIFIIGDFTAMIGDPSGRSAERPLLSAEEIKENVKSFEEQVFKILERRNVKLLKNSEWLKKLGTEGTVKLASNYTVARMLERNDFAKRYESGNPISITEFIYPLLQGYDSYITGADVEVGGTDQKFNLLVGREIQKSMGTAPQAVLTMPLLEGTDGVRKMSKSYGNHIAIEDKPSLMYGKIMSVSDEAMIKYYRLLTLKKIQEVKEMHPMEAKKALARELVKKYHGEKEALNGQAHFEKVFSKGRVPDEIERYTLNKEEKVVDIIASRGLAGSKSAAKRLVNQGGVELEGKKVRDISASVAPGSGLTLKVGKRKFLKLL